MYDVVCWAKEIYFEGEDYVHVFFFVFFFVTIVFMLNVEDLTLRKK